MSEAGEGGTANGTAASIPAGLKRDEIEEHGDQKARAGSSSSSTSSSSCGTGLSGVATGGGRTHVSSSSSSFADDCGGDKEEWKVTYATGTKGTDDANDHEGAKKHPQHVRHHSHPHHKLQGQLDDIAAKIGSISITPSREEEEEEARDEEEEISKGLRMAAGWIKEHHENGAEAGEEKNMAVSKRRKVVVLSGAGVSCSAGIPDFRTPGTGLYDNLQKYNLPFPEAVFDLGFYRSNPDPFVNLASEIWPGRKHSPTLSHSFVTLLDKKGLLVRNYTQNIDGLEVLAGVPESRLVECHGHFRTASCVDCTKSYDGDKCRKSIVERGEAPNCGKCGGLVKPDIVFFGEDLPRRFGRLLRPDLMGAELLIVMGTSLMVAPVSLIPDMVPGRCRRVLLNRELVGNFDVEEGTRDVFEEGDCDESVRRLCRLMGWEEELLELNRSTRIEGGDDCGGAKESR